MYAETERIELNRTEPNRTEPTSHKGEFLIFVVSILLRGSYYDYNFCCCLLCYCCCVGAFAVAFVAVDSGDTYMKKKYCMFILLVS